MFLQLTLQDVADHNRDNPTDKFIVVHGDVYNATAAPDAFNRCKSGTEFYVAESIIVILSMRTPSNQCRKDVLVLNS